MAKQNISEPLKEKLSGIRDRFSNFSFGKMLGSQTSDVSPESRNEKLGASEKTNRDGNVKTRIINTAYYTTVSEGQNKKLKKGDGLADILAKIYNLLKLQNKDTNKKTGSIKSSSSSKIYKSGKSNQYEDIIELLMPAFKVMKLAFSGISGIFKGVVAGISGIIGTISSLIGGTLSLISTVLLDVFKVIKTLGLAIFSLTKGILGLTADVVGFVSGFLFKDIIRPLTSFILSKMIDVALHIAAKAARDPIIAALQAMWAASPPFVKGIIASGLAALGVVAGVMANDKFEKEALEMQVGPRATELAYGLKILRDRAEEEKKQNLKPYQDIVDQRKLAEQQGPLSAARKKYDTMLENYKNFKPNTKAQDELKLYETEYENRKKQYQQSTLKDLLGEDYELDPNQVMKSIFNPKEDKLALGVEKIYGLINTKTGEKISPLIAVARLEAASLIKRNLEPYLNSLDDKTNKYIKPIKEAIPVLEQRAKDFYEAGEEKMKSVENIMGQKLEDITKALKDAGFNVLNANPIKNVVNNVIHQGKPNAGGTTTEVSLRSDESTFIGVNLESSRFV